MGKLRDLSGMKFGRLTVLRLQEIRKRHSYWVCECECGEQVIARQGGLASGRKKSCGCYRIDKMTTHGMNKTRVYRIWSYMRQRCYNPKNIGYKYYGGKGIRVCKRWDYSFENFFADMGHPPTDAHTLDRIDSNGDYEPGNCKWSTRQEQACNRGNNRHITYEGRTLTIGEWAKVVGVNRWTLWRRFKKGLSPKEILFGKCNLLVGNLGSETLDTV